MRSYGWGHDNSLMNGSEGFWKLGWYGEVIARSFCILGVAAVGSDSKASHVRATGQDPAGETEQQDKSREIAPNSRSFLRLLFSL